MDLTGFTLDELTGSFRRDRLKKLIDRIYGLCAPTEENVRRWQEWRDKGLVRPEVAYYVLSRTLEGMGGQASDEAFDKEPLKGLYKKQDAIEAREGLKEDEEFVEGHEPKDWLAVSKKIEKLNATLETEPMRKYGEHEMAELFLKDYGEFRRRGEAGKALLYAEPELAEAKRIIDEANAEAMKEYEAAEREKELEAERLEKENAQNEGRKDD